MATNCATKLLLPRSSLFTCLSCVVTKGGHPTTTNLEINSLILTTLAITILVRPCGTNLGRNCSVCCSTVNNLAIAEIVIIRLLIQNGSYVETECGLARISNNVSNIIENGHCQGVLSFRISDCHKVLGLDFHGQIWNNLFETVFRSATIPYFIQPFILF